MKRLILLLFFVMPLIKGTATAQFQYAHWDTLTSDTLQDRLSHQGLAVNGYEQFHLTYAKPGAAGGWNIYYRIYDMLAGLGPEVLVESRFPSYNPVIASRFSDNDFNIDILFENDDDIWRCSWVSESEWSCDSVTNNSLPKYFPTVAWGSNFLHGAWITYINSEYKIVYMRATGDVTTIIEVLTASDLGQFGSGAQPFIAAEGDVPHIFYRGINGPNYRIHHAYKPHPDSAWNYEYLTTPNADDYTSYAYINGHIHLAISGNEGFGMPGRVYYTMRNYQTGQWSEPELVTGNYSAVNGSLVKAYDTVYVASCGVSGNFYNGNVYLSKKGGSGTFQTDLLGSFQSVTQPLITSIIGEYGVLIFDAPVGSDLQRNIELFYLGPTPLSADDPYLPLNTGDIPCYPNPFNSSTNISFNLKKSSRVSIEIFDILGQKIETLLNETKPAGSYTVNWDASDKPSGIYLYKMTSNGENSIQKMVLLK